MTSLCNPQKSPGDPWIFEHLSILESTDNMDVSSRIQDESNNGIDEEMPLFTWSCFQQKSRSEELPIAVNIQLVQQ
jgi:hypothetical protein